MKFELNMTTKYEQLVLLRYLAISFQRLLISKYERSFLYHRSQQRFHFLSGISRIIDKFDANVKF